MATIRVIDGDGAHRARASEAQLASEDEPSTPGETGNESGAASQPSLWPDAPAVSPVVAVPRSGKLTLEQLEAHLWGAHILRGKTAGQDYKNYLDSP